MPSIVFNDATRTALIIWLQSIFPVLTILGLATLSGDEVAIIMVMITNSITFAMALFKAGQQPDPALLEKAVEDEITRRIIAGNLRSI